MAKELLKQRNGVRIRKVAQFVGKIVACEPGIDGCFLHYRSIERDKTNSLKAAKGNFDKTMKLSNDACEEILWWVNNIHEGKRQLIKKEINHNFYSDSSLIGWGAWLSDKQTQGVWSSRERDDHINVLELKAALLGLQALCSDIKDTHIRMHIDNRTAVSYINKFVVHTP